ncbi:RING finger protein nhl-1-like [Agrilus planipennis]|uniref:RING finger protein nhl-1-like n=1 Tax=Agrilus planipennis TaxID=224129 RepID=A0A1W4WX74_AGRPL|nr:RING finger protein nhl-1-like [Agrilus planipennis]
MMDSSTKVLKRSQSLGVEKMHISSRLQKVKQNMKRLDVTKPNKEGLKSTESSDVLEELLQCGVCLDRLTEPKMLPCQHTFCLSCLQLHLKAEAGRAMNKRHTPPTAQEIESAAQQCVEIKCPTCQYSCSIDKGIGGLDVLPRNLYIDSLLNLLPKPGTKDISSKCMSTPASANYRISTEIRCAKCQTLCKFDETRCQHCVQVFCKVCWTEHMSELKKNLISLVNQLSQTQSKLENKLDDFDQKCSNAEMKIKTAVESKINEIRKEEQQALARCGKCKESENKVAQILKGKIEDVKNDIQKLDFDNIESDIQKVVTFVNFHRATSALIDKVDKWGELNVPLEQTLHMNSLNMESELSGNASSPVLDDDIFCSEYKTRNFTAKLIWNKFPRPAGVAIAPWASHILYIATTDNKSILIMDRIKFKVIGKLTSENMACPYGVACSKTRGEIYVTDKWNHCIHVFSSTGDYINVLSSKGTSEGKLLSPEGIAVCPNNDLVVCDTGNDRAVILNPDDGHEVLSLGKIDKRTGLQAPTGVAIYKNQIIVADSGNNRVKLFSLDGQKLSEFGNKSQFQSIDAIATDPDGFILVGDAGSGRLKIFSPDGLLIRSVGGSQGSDKFSCISGIAVTPDLDIVTTDSRSRKLQIF